MKEKSTETGAESRADLGDAWRRSPGRACSGCCSRLLEEEVEEVLGPARATSGATAVDAEAGYRNGHGKPRRLTMSSGTITLRRPRVRGLEQRFESRLAVVQTANPRGERAAAGAVPAWAGAG